MKMQRHTDKMFERRRGMDLVDCCESSHFRGQSQAAIDSGLLDGGCIFLPGSRRGSCKGSATGEEAREGGREGPLAGLVCRCPLWWVIA